MRAMRSAGLNYTTHRLVIGVDTLDYLNRRMSHQRRSAEPLPALIILDLRLPGADGRDLLREIKRNPQLGHIPVIVMSDSATPAMVNECYEAGANSVIRKRFQFVEHVEALKKTLEYWLSIAALPEPRIHHAARSA